MFKYTTCKMKLKPNVWNNYCCSQISRQKVGKHTQIKCYFPNEIYYDTVECFCLSGNKITGHSLGKMLNMVKTSIVFVIINLYGLSYYYYYRPMFIPDFYRYSDSIWILDIEILKSVLVPIPNFFLFLLYYTIPFYFRMSLSGQKGNFLLSITFQISSKNCKTK